MLQCSTRNKIKDKKYVNFVIKIMIVMIQITQYINKNNDFHYISVEFFLKNK